MSADKLKAALKDFESFDKYWMKPGELFEPGIVRVVDDILALIAQERKEAVEEAFKCQTDTMKNLGYIEKSE